LRKIDKTREKEIKAMPGPVKVQAREFEKRNNFLTATMNLLTFLFLLALFSGLASAYKDY
jgi:hypothetical protein